MGIINNNLGINLTNEDPLINSPYNQSASLMYVVPPPPASYMITETGIFMLDEDGIELMITE